jgi:hypothetical protein
MYDEKFNTLPYDEQYNMIPSMFETFEKSIYNDKNSDLYSCIEQYLKNNYGTTDTKSEWDYTIY